MTRPPVDWSEWSYSMRSRQDRCTETYLVLYGKDDDEPCERAAAWKVGPFKTPEGVWENALFEPVEDVLTYLISEYGGLPSLTVRVAATEDDEVEVALRFEKHDGTEKPYKRRSSRRRVPGP